MNSVLAYFISDSTGLTVESIGEALLDQFDIADIQRKYRPFVDTFEKAEQLVDEINAIVHEHAVQPLIFLSVIDPEIAAIMASCKGYHVSVFDAFLNGLSTELGLPANYRVGKNHGISDRQRYDERINSVDFSLNHDDGMSDKNLNEADVILLGVSRSGKTPTCLYLALHYGLRAANYPLTAEDLARPELPEMVRPYADKIFGLTIDPERLSMIRQARRPNSRYADWHVCRQEVASAQRMFNRYDIPFISTTHKSVEELSVNIMQTCKLKRRI